MRAGSITRWLSPRGRGGVVVLLGLCGLAFATLLPPMADPRPAPREVLLEARGMAFYVVGETEPNPTIRLNAGEEVRIVLRNQDPGLAHRFSIKDWELSMALPRGDVIRSVRVRVPERAGRHEYVCGPHSTVMAGVIEVISRQAPPAV